MDNLVRRAYLSKTDALVLKTAGCILDIEMGTDLDQKEAK
jgi:hypothetical protein